MNIAVLGWYGHDNAGDERIKYCLESFLIDLGGVDCVDFFDLHEEAIAGSTNKFDDYDLVIIGGGGLILSQHNYHDFILGIQTKIVTLGISVETTLKGNPKKFAKALLSKSSAFLVRDKSSYDKLSSLEGSNKVKISSDLTFLSPFSTTRSCEGEHLGVNLLPKPKYIKYSTMSNQILSRILGYVERFGGYNLLSIVSYEAMLSFLKDKYTCLPIPLYCPSQAEDIATYRKNDVNFLKLYFSNVPEFFSNDFLDKCFALITMRLHGAIFAVQKGIPLVSFEYLPKNRNFMKEAGLEEFVLESTDPLIVRGLIEKLQNENSSIREKMEMYTEKSKNLIRKDLVVLFNKLFG